MSAGHKGGHLLVTDLNIVHLVPGTPNGPNDAVNPITREPKDSVNAPFIETLDQEIADVDTHGILFSLPDSQMRLPYWKKKNNLSREPDSHSPNNPWKESSC